MAVVTTDLRTLGLEIEGKKKYIAELEDKLAKKDATLRQASEEYKLMQELHTINQLTKRKLEIDLARPNRMPISAESLARIVALEDEIKLVDKRKQDLDAEAALLDSQTKRTEEAIDEVSNAVATIKDVTGWDRYQYASRGYVNATNLFREHQRRLSKLEDEQSAMKETTQKLTDRIEQLSKDLEAAKDLEDKFQQAKLILEKRDADLKNVEEEIAQIKRISLRKEKMLDTKEGSDVTDAKKLKELEGDKRVLHADLNRLKEHTRAAEKSIMSQDLKLRQLESKLAVVSAFLVDKFAPADEQDDKAREPVPVKQFNQLHDQLTSKRLDLRQRDIDLDVKDETIEALEHKHNILVQARISRTAATNQGVTDINRENEAIRERVAAIDEDFEKEQARLLSEQQRLQQTLDRITRSKP